MARKPKEPCCATVYAYDTTIPCGRPVGHTAKLPMKEFMGEMIPDTPSFTWDGGHCETPLKKDGPVYGTRKTTNFVPDIGTVYNA